MSEPERDQMARADAVYAHIEIITDDLSTNLAVVSWLRLQLHVKEAQVGSLKSQIEKLHAERNAIFHEES